MSKPLSANDQAVKKLADELWGEMLSHSPIWGTFLGIEVDDGALDDTSDAARLRDRAMWEKYSKAAAAIGDDGLDIEWRITRDLIKVGGEIAPGVEARDKPTEPLAWRVAGLDAGGLRRVAASACIAGAAALSVANWVLLFWIW